MGTEDKIRELKDELSTTKYNKRTQGHIGIVKAKIARLREKAERKGGGKGEGFTVAKSGDASVVLLGFPSVGKSTLLNSLTGTKSKTASYAFTTLKCIPGMLEYNSARIQVLDVPGIITGAARGAGRGREVISVIRNSDLLLFLIDVREPLQYAALLDEVREANIRPNESPPRIKIRPTERGGVSVASTVKITLIDKETIESILKEYRIMNSEVVLHENCDVDRFIDAIEQNKHYVPGILVFNKCDLVDEKRVLELKKDFPDALFVSAQKETQMAELKQKIFHALRFIRVYLKKKGARADLDVPLILRQGASVETVVRKLHKGLLAKFRFARVWGRSAKFPGQVHQLNHALLDSDIVELTFR